MQKKTKKTLKKTENIFLILKCVIYLYCKKQTKPLKLNIMTISKKLLRNEIETTKYLIEQYNEESRNFPQIKFNNDKQVLKMMGKLEAFESLIKTF